MEAVIIINHRKDIILLRVISSITGSRISVNTHIIDVWGQKTPSVLIWRIKRKWSQKANMSHLKIKILIIDKFTILECLIKYFLIKAGYKWHRIFFTVLRTIYHCVHLAKKQKGKLASSHFQSLQHTEA